MNEQWKPVVGYETLYEVSNLGRVRSQLRRVLHKGRPITRQPQVLKPWKRKGYLCVKLCDSGVHKTFDVHRLVAAAWIGICPKGQEVCHGPNGKDDNSPSNLSYGTRVDNMQDRFRDGTYKLRSVKRGDGTVFGSIKEAAKLTGCDPGNIGRVCRGKSLTAGGFEWEYV